MRGAEEAPNHARKLAATETKHTPGVAAGRMVELGLAARQHLHESIDEIGRVLKDVRKRLLGDLDSLKRRDGSDGCASPSAGK